MQTPSFAESVARNKSWHSVARASLIIFGLGCSLGASSSTRSQELDGLLTQERDVLTELEHATMRVARGRAAIDRVEHELGVVEYKLRESKRRAHAIRERILRSKTYLRRRLLALYKITRGGYMRVLSEANTTRVGVQHRAATVSRVVRADAAELRLYRQELAVLTGQQKRAQSQQHELGARHEQLFARQGPLENSRKRYDARLLEVRRARNRYRRARPQLSEQERALLASVTRLEQRRQAGLGFVSLKGHLPRPVDGKVIRRRRRGIGTPSPAGPPPRTTRSARVLRAGRLENRRFPSLAQDGVMFRAGRNTPVRAVAKGTVRVAGPLEGYGEVVLLEHDRRYFSVYGFLARVKIRVGDVIEQRGVLGQSGMDPLSRRGAVYFDLRHDHRSLDPSAWLRAH